MDSFSSLTASEARQNFYRVVKDVARGLGSYEIRLRGADSVVIVNRDELESWLETLDILSSPEEAKAVRKAKRERKLIPLARLLKRT